MTEDKGEQQPGVAEGQARQVQQALSLGRTSWLLKDRRSLALALRGGAMPRRQRPNISARVQPRLRACCTCRAWPSALSLIHI